MQSHSPVDAVPDDDDDDDDEDDDEDVREAIPQKTSDQRGVKGMLEDMMGTLKAQGLHGTEHVEKVRFSWMIPIFIVQI